MRNRTILLVGLCLGLLVAGGATFLRSTRNDDPVLSAPRGTAATLTWTEGDASLYQVRVDSSASFANGSAIDDTPFSQRFEGRLRMQVLSVGDDEVELGLHFEDAALSLGGAPVNARAFSEPFRVRVTRGGLPVAFEFPERVDAEHRALLQELVRTFQVDLREDDVWTSEERHGTGLYEARYERQGPTAVARRKLRYVEERDERHTRVHASSALVELPERGSWLGSMELDETLVSDGFAETTVRVTTRASLRRTTVDAAEPAPGRFAFEAREPLVVEAVADDAPRRSRQELEADLRARVAAIEAGEDRLGELLRLRDLLLEDEALARTLLGTMETSELASETHAALLHALELAGTGVAQEVLREVVAAPAWGPLDRSRAIVALGGLARPTEETLAFLWETTATRGDAVTDDLANTATLALGTLGERMHADDLVGYEELRGRLVDAVWDARTSDERAVVALALGNTHDPDLTEAVLPFLEDADAGVRRAVAKSLGRLGSDAAAYELFDRFGREGASAVRASIAASLESWSEPTPEAVAALRAHVVEESDVRTRLSLARFLGERLDDFPENRATLEALLEIEPSKQVRLYVAEALAKAD